MPQIQMSNFYHHLHFVACTESCISQNNDAQYLATHVRQPVRATCLRQADDPAFQAIYLFPVYLIIILVTQTTGHQIKGLQSNKFKGCGWSSYILNQVMSWSVPLRTEVKHEPQQQSLYQQDMNVVLPSHKSKVLPLNRCVLLTHVPIYNVTLLLPFVPSMKHRDQM